MQEYGKLSCSVRAVSVHPILLEGCPDTDSDVANSYLERVTIELERGES